MKRHIAMLRARKLCKYKTISSNRLYECTITIFTRAKKKYYVRVRSYKTVNGKRNYSKWSAIKAVKTK